MKRYAVPVLFMCGMLALGGCRVWQNWFCPLSDLDQKTSLTNLKMIGLAVAVYRDSTGGCLPGESGAAGLTVVGQVIHQPRTFIAPFDEEATLSTPPFTEQNTSYAFIAGGEKWPTGAEALSRASSIPVALERPCLRSDGKVGVLFLDGHVALIAGDFSDCEAVVRYLEDASAASAPVWETLRANARAVDAASRQ